MASKIISISRFIEPQIDLEVIDEDPDDDKILETAVAGNVDLIVSGDSHLQQIGEYNGIEIYSPTTFIEKVSE